MSACAVSAEETKDIISEDEVFTPGEDPTFLDEPNSDDSSGGDDESDSEVDGVDDANDENTTGGMRISL